MQIPSVRPISCFSTLIIILLWNFEWICGDCQWNNWNGFCRRKSATPPPHWLSAQTFSHKWEYTDAKHKMSPMYYFFARGSLILQYIECYCVRLDFWLLFYHHKTYIAHLSKTVGILNDINALEPHFDTHKRRTEFCERDYTWCCKRGILVENSFSLFRV
jgi:hypothetical protein